MLIAIREIKVGFGIILDGVPDNYRGKIMPKPDNLVFKLLIT